MSLNTLERAANPPTETSDAVLLIDGAESLRGDTLSIAIIFNNLSGANFGDDTARMNHYLRHMRKEFAASMQQGSQLQVNYDNRTIASACVWEANAVGIGVADFDASTGEAIN